MKQQRRQKERQTEARKRRSKNSGLKRLKFASHLRNFTFGVEDSLVSTVGLLSGIAAAGVPRQTIFLTGVVLIFVEAFSMAVGSLLSEHSAEDYLKKKESSMKEPAANSGIMFVSYFIAGFIPLLPYAFLEVAKAFPLSILLSLLSLFALGAFNGRLTKNNMLKEGLEMLILGGIAIAIGVVVGSMLKGI